jgi:hypothetical protein
MVDAALAAVAEPELGRSPALELDLVPASVCWLSVAADWDLPPVPAGLAAPGGCGASGSARPWVELPVWVESPAAQPVVLVTAAQPELAGPG